MSESKKGFPQKKKASDFIIYAVIAIVLAAVGVWGGYVLQETANMKGEVNFQKALDRFGDYMNLNSFLFAIISALTDNGIAKKGGMYGGMAGLLVFTYQLSKTPKRFHRKGEEHGSARWGTDKEKLIGGDANDFYNNVILADDVFIVVDRKKRDMNALSPKKRKAAEQKKEQEKKQNEIRLAKLKENIEAYRLENSPVGNDKE